MAALSVKQREESGAYGNYPGAGSDGRIFQQTYFRTGKRNRAVHKAILRTLVYFISIDHVPEKKSSDAHVDDSYGKTDVLSVGIGRPV